MEKQNDFLALDEVYTTQSYDYYQKVWVARNLCILTINEQVRDFA